MFNFKGFYGIVKFPDRWQYMSITNMFNAYSGLAAETAGLNENGVPKEMIFLQVVALFHGIVESTETKCLIPRDYMIFVLFMENWYMMQLL
jgi:hypothetical protein